MPGTVMSGTGVMIGAGIFALTGQMAQMGRVFFSRWRFSPLP
ncbi:MAG: hypothetical protein U5K38_03280 [Woeseiaceae bacterium]|nr:hypothetical protein [Woeseiaceae bacterium]